MNLFLETKTVTTYMIRHQEFYTRRFVVIVVVDP